MKLAAPYLADTPPRQEHGDYLSSRAHMHTARTGSSCASAGLPFGGASASPLGFEKACPPTICWGLVPFEFEEHPTSAETPIPVRSGDATRARPLPDNARPTGHL